MHETIAAVSSGAGRAGVAVIRVSGPQAGHVLRRLAGVVPEPRVATLRWLRDGAGDKLDQALVLWFPGQASFTGEPIVEFHCHGGRAVVSAVLDEICSVDGCRMAEPGEFTLRAFRAGRIDLTEAEALGDLISAETEAQRRQAVAGLEGGLHRRAESWRAALLRAAALVEATIDWADEEVPEDVSPEVLALIDQVLEEMAGEVALAAGAEKLRHGLGVALVGAPNAGKSSFLNMLAGREAAITSPEAGTTRDVVELRYDLAGLPVVFLDMAGLRVAEADVEAEGVRRAEARARGAQLRLHLVAPDAPLPDMAEALWSAGDLRVGTKADVAQVVGVDFAVSSVTGEGIAPLMDAVSERLASVVGEGGLLGHRRARDSVEATGTALRSARANLDAAPPEVVAEDLRRALNELGRVVGRVDVEEVLGAVFSQFCLGK